jgi:hypothetical protein
MNGFSHGLVSQGVDIIDGMIKAALARLETSGR